jgi:hypothetical protein
VVRACAEGSENCFRVDLEDEMRSLGRSWQGLRIYCGSPSIPFTTSPAMAAMGQCDEPQSEQRIGFL